MLKRVLAVYFSGTGTTEKTVKTIAKKAADELRLEYGEWDFTPLFAREKPLNFTDEDLVIFGMPVIAGRVPNLMLKYLAQMNGGEALAVPVVLFGNRNFDDALVELRDILTGDLDLSRWNFAKWWIAPKNSPRRGDMWQKARGAAVDFSRCVPAGNVVG